MAFIARKESKRHIEGMKVAKSKNYLVKELKETYSVDELNNLVKNGWIVLDCAYQVIDGEVEFKFLLGRIEGER